MFTGFTAIEFLLHPMNYDVKKALLKGVMFAPLICIAKLLGGNFQNTGFFLCTEALCNVYQAI
jgi:hypothetical protein